LQNIARKIKSPILAASIVSILFAFAHFGYGIQSFIHSFIFSAAAIIITQSDQGIERAAGFHFINNFMLLNLFVDVKEVTNPSFDWSINWSIFVANIVSISLMLFLSGVFKQKEKPIKISVNPLAKSPLAG